MFKMNFRGVLSARNANRTLFLRSCCQKCDKSEHLFVDFVSIFVTHAKKMAGFQPQSTEFILCLVSAGRCIGHLSALRCADRISTVSLSADLSAFRCPARHERGMTSHPVSVHKSLGRLRPDNRPWLGPHLELRRWVMVVLSDTGKKTSLIARVGQTD